MAIKNGKINPLDVLGLRRVQFPAHHFVYTTIPHENMSTRSIAQWIEENLSGRYYLRPNIGLDPSRVLIYTLDIGFENEKELTFFLLKYSEIK